MRTAFMLAWRSAVRGRLLASLLVLAAAAFAFLPAIVRADGTAAGFREMYVRAVFGAVYSLTLVTLFVCSAGATAQARSSFRLAQAMVRPVSAFSLIAGRWLALCAVAAAVLAFSSVLTLVLTDFGKAPCFRHHAPALPPEMVCAKAALEAFLANPETPEAVRKAPRGTVLSILAARESDRYDVIRAGEAMTWPFAHDVRLDGGGASVRVRFATQFNLRSSVRGDFSFRGMSGTVSNNTQAVIDVPLMPSQAGCSGPEGGLAFTNLCGSAVMLRPRRDLEILVPSDSFAANMLRAVIGMLAVIATFVAIGLFLSSALSRPTAVFTALVSLAVVMMSPDVADRFVDGLDASLADRIGVALSRGIQSVTSSLSGFSPVSALATDRSVEWGELMRICAVDMLALPAVFLALAAFICRRKPL